MYKTPIPSKNLPRKIGSTNMTPYWKIIETIISESNIILEVLDARMPEISQNEKIEELVKKSGKPLIFILNKADLTSEIQLKIKFEKLKKQAPTFIISSKEKIGTKRLRDFLIVKSKKFERFKVGVLGYPNTGKSSLINKLALRKKAKISSKAGTTHGMQWISAGKKILIIDSPGVIPLNQNDEVRYALIASKNIEKIKNLELVAHKIISLFGDKKPLENLYHIKITSNSPDEIIKAVAHEKKFLKKHGLEDIERTSIQIIRDWQRGLLNLR